MYRVWIQGRFKKPGDDIFDHFGPIESNNVAEKESKNEEEIITQGKMDKKIQEKLEEKL